MTINKTLTEITIADLQSLVDDKEAESQTIDYKETIKLEVPQNKEEFRRDASSFANASGGDYILGIREEAGFPFEVCGMPLDNPDGFKLRLEEILQSHIRPRIPGIQIQPIQLPNGPYVTFVRIPRSFARPHQVTINKDDYQFWSRNAAGKYRLDVDQLRTAFLLSETLEERVRNFRRERLGSIIAGEMPISMSNQPKIVLHLVPLDAFDSASRYDLSQIDPNKSNMLWPLNSSSLNRRFNFDGILNFYGQGGTTDTYVQLFRNGIVEAVNDELLTYDQNGKKLLRLTHCETELIKALPNYVHLQRTLGIASPIVVMVSLLGVKGYSVPVNPNRFLIQNRLVDRDVLIVPEIVIEDVHFDPEILLRPVFDALWNASGQPCCPNYDENGKWREEPYM